MASTPKSTDTGLAHDRVYRTLRNQVMFGELPPGKPLTLRGIGQMFDVSMTPAREAVRRLVAEGAFTLSASGRVSTPEIGIDRIEELASIRALLEGELARRALPRAHPALIDRLRLINSTVDEMIAKQDASGYIRSNLEFHRTLYLRAQAPAMLAMVETVWLQLGPTMRQLYSKMRFSGRLGHHRAILKALSDGDEQALQSAIGNDVTQGLRMLTV
ncbi:MAG: DNA-binding GntR family transcriptional regulator [Paracoccaceae bacterium]|jgi:DNA-binding GntR family transcriptional regulator